MEDNFDYDKALEELEALAAKVEDPETGIADIDASIKKAAELIEKARAYLRSSREKLENL
ncbi:MAG: exodeoxyribonuclease VII small subunit [Bacteroidales bacterium]|nr:exodeoxyribonuclease VII small subunit [Bacteroidales bacterium]